MGCFHRACTNRDEEVDTRAVPRATSSPGRWGASCTPASHPPGERHVRAEWAEGGWRGTLPLSTIGNQDREIGPQHIPLEMTGLGRKYVKIIRKWAAEANGHEVLAFSGSFQFQLGCVFLDFIYMFLFLQPFLVFSFPLSSPPCSPFTKKLSLQSRVECSGQAQAQTGFQEWSRRGVFVPLLALHTGRGRRGWHILHRHADAGSAPPHPATVTSRHYSHVLCGGMPPRRLVYPSVSLCFLPPFHLFPNWLLHQSCFLHRWVT